MQPRIENVLRLAMTISSVESVLREICALYGEVVSTRVMFTRQELLPRQITAIVEMEETVALYIAFAHAAQNLGTRLVVFRYDAPDGFQFEDQTGPPGQRLDAVTPVARYDSASPVRSAVPLRKLAGRQALPQ